MTNHTYDKSNIQGWGCGWTRDGDNNNKIIGKLNPNKFRM